MNSNSLDPATANVNEIGTDPSYPFIDHYHCKRLKKRKFGPAVGILGRTRREWIHRV